MRFVMSSLRNTQSKLERALLVIIFVSGSIVDFYLASGTIASIIVPVNGVLNIGMISWVGPIGNVRFRVGFGIGRVDQKQEQEQERREP